jgi:hypothetical protein
MLVIQNVEHYKQVVNQIKESRGSGEILTNLDQALFKCSMYSCDWLDQAKTRVSIGYDFAKWSFSILIERRNDQEIGGYDFWMNGGLIYDENTLNWSMHT